MFNILKLEAPSLRSVMSNKFLKLTVETEEEHRSLSHLLEAQDAELKTFMLKTDRPIKVVLRGLPSCTPIEEIKEELQKEVFAAVNITQLSKFQTKTPMPLLYAQIANGPLSETVYILTKMFGTKISVERYRGRKGPSQCWRCQGSYHSSEACKLPIKCISPLPICPRRHVIEKGIVFYNFKTAEQLTGLLTLQEQDANSLECEWAQHAYNESNKRLESLTLRKWGSGQQYMVKTRSQATMADSGNGDLLALLAEMKKSIEAGQERLEKEIRSGRERMEEMKAGQERLEKEMRSGQERMEERKAGLEKEMRSGQERMEEMKAGLEKEMRSGQERIEQ
ncbi:Nucleic-acid-binding protein transposon like protein [Argiope bruennichi]|uniref:Nucleic-acid-binding protein transposon like protein n=1 Tax=Argiope bruennichi TaxID=94029 RepID=A0A8T0ESN6_ARGBR|nr:Nucleic-acid-binding protein transposon like protein [Argiope bruennichi]